jgi:hypothetical protein
MLLVVRMLSKVQFLDLYSEKEILTLLHSKLLMLGN